MSKYIIYHKVTEFFDCPDGIASLWVTLQTEEYKDASYEGMLYFNPQQHNIDAYINHFEKLVSDQGISDFLFVDYSIPIELIRFFKDNHLTYKIIDHHKAFKIKWENTFKTKLYSFENNILTNKNYIYNVNECGATLTWKYFFPDKEVPLFLKYIRDRDLFIKELDYTNEIHCAMQNLKRNFALFDDLYQMESDEFFQYLVTIGSPIWQKKLTKINYLIAKYLIKIKHIGYIELPVSYKSLKSDLAEQILKKNLDLKLVCIPSGGRVSLKARRDLNLLEPFYFLPELGGHDAAINFCYFEDFLDVIINTPLIKPQTNN